MISIKKNVKNILIPSEERKLQMYPMDYEEFLWATEKASTAKLLRGMLKAGKAIEDSIHRNLLRDFRLYMLVGGMLQAALEYLETNNFYKVDAIKRDILSLYADDFRKIDGTGRMGQIFLSIPAQLNSNASRYNISNVIANGRLRNTAELLAELEDSKTVLVAHHANDPNVGMSSNMDLGKFKLFMADTGLFVTQMFMDRDYTENIIYAKLLQDKLSANLGYLYENVIAQILAANGNKLYYYTFFNEKSRHNYEVDFMLPKGNKLCPIEVKSSGYKTHASLDAFSRKYSSRIDMKYLVYTKNLYREADVMYLPVYLVPFFVINRYEV